MKSSRRWEQAEWDRALYLQMDVTSDHQRFIATLLKEKEKDYLNVIVNWFEEVRKRAFN